MSPWKMCRIVDPIRLSELRRGKHRWNCTSCGLDFTWGEGSMWDGLLLCQDEGHWHAMLCPTCVADEGTVTAAPRPVSRRREWGGR